MTPVKTPTACAIVNQPDLNVTSMETAVKTLKEEVIEYLTQSENARLFEHLKREIAYFEENQEGRADFWQMMAESEYQFSTGQFFSQEEVEKELQEWKSRRKK